MAKPPPTAPMHSVDTPQEFAQVAPRDLHPVADIRLVITDVAKLTERIDNLIERVGDLKADGKETRDRLFSIEKSISFVKGAMWVLGGLFTIALVVIGVLLRSKIGG
jgi:hypothetical protein